MSTGPSVVPSDPISTREQLADALTIAAELEHGLLLQYLFAAYSLKTAPDTQTTAAQVDLCLSWERQVLRVAHAEMAHLGTVCNLLAAIGHAPQFRRPNFPQPPSPLMPFDFELTRYSDEALYRFMRAEKPADRDRPAPPPGVSAETAASDPILFDTTGQLYRQIKAGFETLVKAIGPDQVFIGSSLDQDTSTYWSNKFNVMKITDLASAQTAIDTIVTDGEGATGSPEDEQSHFDVFEDLREDLAGVPPFPCAKPVAANPRVNEHLFGAPAGTLIVDPLSRKVAGLFNDVYGTVLLMLMQYYSRSGEDAAQVLALREAIRTSMSMVIRPIAEVLMLLPVGGVSTENAGPGFEIEADLRLSTQLASRWTILDERLRAGAAAAKKLAANGAALVRLEYIGGSIERLAAKLRDAAPS